MTNETSLPARSTCRFANLLPGGLFAILAALAVITTPTARAVPYASGVTNVAGTVSFTLNEAADNVTVVFDGGASSTDLGARTAGVHTFSLGVHTSFSIEVRKSGATGYLTGDSNRIGVASNPLTLFFAPRGVAVNRNPGSPNFGRIYVAEGGGGNATASGARTTTDGIFILNADQSDAVGQGNNGRTNGVYFANSTSTPWKIEVGEDDTLYIADSVAASGTIYATDADVTTISNLLAGSGATANPTVHTTITGSPVPSGSLAAGNLTLWAIDGQWPGAGNRNRLLRWEIGAGPLPWNTPPAVLGGAGNGGTDNVYSDVDRGPDGKLYTLQNRSAGTDTDSLRVYDTDGVTFLWRSLINTGSPDVLRSIRAVKVSPDGKVIALNRDDGRTWIIRLTNGIPDMTTTNLLDSFITANSTGRDVAFDAAGNLYVISNNAEQLRVFSAGGTTRAITRSDGTFELVRPPAVSVEVFDPLASENGADTATFSIYRTGDTAADLTVTFTLAGTAAAGADFTTPPFTATIPAGLTNVEVVITPVDDSDAEPVETVVLTLVSGITYDLSPPSSATVRILDNETPLLTIATARPLVYEGGTLWLPEFTVTRLGDTNAYLFVEVGLTNSTVTEGEDIFFQPTTYEMLPGVIALKFPVPMLADENPESDEVLGFALKIGIDPYTIGTPNAAYTTVRDDDYAAECVLFRDDFETDTAANWTTLFGANNGIDDKTVLFSDDYGARGIPAAPHSGGTTRGLFLQVNKNNATALGSAGVNVYPFGQTFSGDYSLRFDMYLTFAGASTTEHALAGLNHSGLVTNRVTQSAGATFPPNGGDGVFASIETDGSNNRDWSAYTWPNPTALATLITNRPASTLTNVFRAPPFAFPGSIGNAAPPVAASNHMLWADVELRQAGGIVTLSVNRDPVFSFANTSGFNAGNIMLGMNDQFDSVGATGNFVVFDNVRVIDLNPIRITGITPLGGGQYQIDFTAPCATLEQLHVQSAADPTSPANFADDNTAVIIANGPAWRATVTAAGPQRYYRIRR